MKISVERSSNFYRTLKTTYTLFVRHRGKVYKVHLVHVKFSFTEILKDFRALLKENAELRAKLKEVEDEVRTLRR